VILERQQNQDDRREPEQVRAHRETEPQQDVAQIERVSHGGKRSRRDKRTETIAACARNRANMVNGPEPDGLAGGDNHDPETEW